MTAKLASLNGLAAIILILLLQLKLYATTTKSLDGPYRFAPYRPKPRQNDKFLYKYPKGYQQDSERGFLLNEEIGPNGVTHGGYGYLDAVGDLVYVEYQKDLGGKVSKTETKVVPQYGQSPISNSVEDESYIRTGRHIDPPLIEYGFVPIKGQSNLYHKKYYNKKAKEQVNSLPPYGPPYNDDKAIKNQIDKHPHELKGHFQESPKKVVVPQLPKVNPTPGSVGYQQILFHGIDTYYDIPKEDHHFNLVIQEEEEEPLKSDHSVKEERDTFSIWKQEQPTIVTTEKPRSVEQVKIKDDKLRLHHHTTEEEDQRHALLDHQSLPKRHLPLRHGGAVKHHVVGPPLHAEVPPHVHHEVVTPVPDFHRVEPEIGPHHVPLSHPVHAEVPHVPRIHLEVTPVPDFHHEVTPLPEVHHPQTLGHPVRDILRLNEVGFQPPKVVPIVHEPRPLHVVGHPHHQVVRPRPPHTTLPPLVVSALPRLIQHTNVVHKDYDRPFLASTTPATYLINPSTTVSTLRPLVKSTKSGPIKVTTAVPPNFHVTVSSHGEDSIKVAAFPLPPIPTFAEPLAHTSRVPTTIRPPTRIKYPPIKKTQPPFLKESLSQIPRPLFPTSPQPLSPEENNLVGEIKHFVNRGLDRPQIHQLPHRPNVFQLSPRLNRPFRSTTQPPKSPKMLESFKTIPLEKPYQLKLQVEDAETSGTRKLRDYGVYRAASSRVDNDVSSSEIRPLTNNDEDLLIAFAENHTFNRL